MAVTYQNVVRRPVYYHVSTTNRSFLNMSYYLRDQGCPEPYNKFMLAIIDPGLAHIDPFDPKLDFNTKVRVTREASTNYWYYLRECVRIPDQGGSVGVGGGAKYQLHRANMALNFCMVNNINVFLEQPRQTGKTISTICWYLWLFNWGTSNSEIIFLHKKLEESKLNLQRLRDIRAGLPTYLQMDKLFDPVTGKQLKTPNTVETLQHPFNMNKIKTTPSARNKVNAANLLRGRTIPLIWADEYAFIPYNDIIYSNMVPAFNTAAGNARRNGAYYGIVITTTPGFLTTDEGIAAYNMKNNATPFSESWYSRTYEELRSILDCNTRSSFVYIRYTYQQLGKDEQWFKGLCIDMMNKWEDIRREVLLEWAEASENCPFSKDDLEVIKVFKKQPIRKQLMMGGKYEFNIYDDTADAVHYPPIIGVDVSGGYYRDSSAITIIDSKTTNVIADFNCNYISTVDLARLIYELVTQYMPNAVINIERNGGFGSTVLTHLAGTSLRKNLYWEIKDTVTEERFDGAKVIRRTQKVKKYGSDSTKHVREELIEILRNRVENHKDKFISPIIISEMEHMEVKKNGRIEHSNNTHDDQVFSYLWALYVWYNGQNLMENWNIQKNALRTDADLEEAIVTIDEKHKSLLQEVIADYTEEVEQQLNKLMPTPVKSYAAWVREEYEKDQRATQALCATPIGKMAYANHFHMPPPQDNGLYKIPDSVFGDGGDDGMPDEFSGFFQ